jgi:hypothetical protein
MRAWINPLSEPDVKLVQGIAIGADEDDAGDGAQAADAPDPATEARVG